MVGQRKRIMIVGQPGSGKSTLARQLGQVTGLPVFHIDLIHWKSGWIERSGPEKDQLCAQVHAQDNWIFEGGRSSTWTERLDRADTLIWLDFPLPIRAWRIFWRTIRHFGKSRPDLPEGCPESFNWEFIEFIWRTRKTNRLKMQQLFNATTKEKDKYWLRSRVEVEQFIEQLKGAAAPRVA